MVNLSPKSILMRTCLLLCFVIALVTTACQKDPIENKPPTVNAGPDAVIHLHKAADSLQLTGTAADGDGAVVAYLWSQVSGPNSSTIHNPGSPSTFVSNLVSGVYVFQLMATDDKGATGIKTVRLTVDAPEAHTLTLQPHNSAFDLHLQVVNTTSTVDPMAPEIGAVAWTVNSEPALVRGLVKFDLSALPANATITSAKLTLYSNPTPLNGNFVDANYGSDNTMLVQRVTSNWTSSISWQSQPSVETATQLEVPHTSLPRLDLTNLDVTGLVTTMRQSGNYGFMIRLKNEVIYTSRVFCSSKYPDASKHPKLEITYTN